MKRTGIVLSIAAAGLLGFAYLKRRPALDWKNINWTGKKVTFYVKAAGKSSTGTITYENAEQIAWANGSYNLSARAADDKVFIFLMKNGTAVKTLVVDFERKIAVIQ